jgi:hypothetical protein
MLAAAIAATPAAATVHTPPVGSAERHAVLEALRPSIEAQFRVPIAFVPHMLCVSEGWAVILADPQRKGGGQVPWQRVMSQAEYDIGGIEVSAVLRYRNDRWNLVESAYGATDVWYEGLVPRSLRGGC